jgi:secreted PhoX family phosphatase
MSQRHQDEDRRPAATADLARRDVLKLAAGSAMAALLPLPLRWRVAAAGGSASASIEGAPFTVVPPSKADELLLAPELRMELLAVEGDVLLKSADGKATALVGGGCDHTAFVPIDALSHKADLAAPHRGFVASAASSREGLLVVNHEGLSLQLFHDDWTPGQPKSERHLAAEQHAIGVSVLHVKRGDDGKWGQVAGSRFTRRIDANTPHRLVGPAAAIDGGPAARGTLANCSGGRTPWGTTLSCEENFHEFASEEAEFLYRWPKEPYATKRHWGWVVEIDPFEPASTPRKLTALGRMRHENVALRVGGDGTLVAYMGDDKNDSCLFKFVADGKVTGDRAKDSLLLETGKLYVAQLEPEGGAAAASTTTSTRGRWLLLDLAKQEKLGKAKRDDGSAQFATQADVLAEAAAAAKVIGATPLERPEDVEIHPLDGSLYVALTNQKKRTPKDWHGRICRLVEKGGEPAAMEFDWSLFAEGGAKAGFSCPDNLAFDARGDLWVTCDITSEELATGKKAAEAYAPRGNNGLFFFRTSGLFAGEAFQAASGPVDSELTGPCFTPDGATLFLSVQHPGEESPSKQQLSSHWPRGGKELPRSAVVAITGFAKGT